MNARILLGYRKWSVAVLAILVAAVMAAFNRLSTELAGVIGTTVTGFFAVNGYTTGKGREPQPESTGSTPTENL